MTPLQGLWLVSIVGAASFFAAGFLWARRRSIQRADAAPRPTLPKARTARAPDRGRPRRARTEADLQRVLDSIAGLPGMKAAVLADELGLPIAAVGECSEPLAAVAGFVDNVAEKSRTYLPLGRIHRIVIEDDHRTTITAHPAPLGDGTIAVVTLTAGNAPSERVLDRVLESASRTFGANAARREA